MNKELINVITSYQRRSTTSYRMTVTSKDDPNLLALKKLVAHENKAIRSWARISKKLPTQPLLVVRLMARGKRLDSKGKPLHPNAQVTLQHKYAERFDVYINVALDAMRALEAELETGMTAHEQRKVRNLEHEALIIKWKAKDRLRNN